MSDNLQDLIDEARSRENAWVYTSGHPSETEGREYRRLMILLADALETQRDELAAAWAQESRMHHERDAARATLAKVQEYADERAWYGSLNRAVGSNRIASDLLAILSGSSQGDTEPSVCPHEDCPYPVSPGSKDCGNHESWMT